jgi:hypothetical protein
MRETPDLTPDDAADAEVKRIAGGAVGTAVFLLGLGAVWWVYSIVYALTTLPHGNPEYLNTSEGFSLPWQMPFAVFAIPCAVAALALLITGMRLQRPRESAWRHADLSAQALTACASAGLGVCAAPMLVLGADPLTALGEAVSMILFPGFPFWLTVIYGWRLRNALWRPSVIQTCGAQATPNGVRRRLQTLLLITAGTVAGAIGGLTSWK